MVMDTSVHSYVASVASALAELPHLAGVYLHGSAVLGGFDARRSDIDVLAVYDGTVAAEQQAQIAAALNERTLPCPALGLELSVVTRETAGHPTASPAFELHLTTAPAHAQVIDGHEHPGDPDLVLHFAVCRQSGRLFGPGLPPADVFGRVPRDLILAQLSSELSWGTEHADGEYAVLNACRAWRFAVDGALVSKIDGGRWALGRVDGLDRELVAAALDRQRCLPAASLVPDAVRRFVERTLRYTG
jgi:hypothetical protein